MYKNFEKNFEKKLFLSWTIKKMSSNEKFKKLISKNVIRIIDIENTIRIDVLDENFINDNNISRIDLNKTLRKSLTSLLKYQKEHNKKLKQKEEKKEAKRLEKVQKQKQKRNEKKQEKQQIFKQAEKLGFKGRKNTALKRIQEYINKKKKQTEKQEKRLQKELERLGSIDVDVDELDSNYFFDDVKRYKLLNNTISDENYMLNKPYRLTRVNTILTNLIYNTIVKKKNLFSQGVDISVKLIFFAHKKDQPIEKTQSTSQKLPTDVKGISNYLLKLYEKFEANSEMVVDVLSVRYLIVPLSTEGGCNERTHKETIQVSKHQKIKIINHFSRNNNCLFAVFNHHYKLKGNQIKPDEIRKQLNISLGSMIDYKQVPQILEYYNKMTNKDYGFLLINKNYEIIALKDETRLIDIKMKMCDANEIKQEDYVKIMIHDEHYYEFELSS